jgi:integrase/recombinase XerC
LTAQPLAPVIPSSVVPAAASAPGPLAAGLPTPMTALVRHAAERHAPPDGRLLRYADGRPVTCRRHDGLRVRTGRHLPWARTQQISTHRLRHTTLTWAERNFGFAVAHAYAGHTDGTGDWPGPCR